MSIRDYIDSLRNIIRRYNVDNTEMDDRIILDWINSQRALWLKNELNKGRSIEDNVKQTIDGIELEVVNASSFSPVYASDYLLKSKQQIPKMIELSHYFGHLLIRNSNIRSVRYNYVHRDRIPYVGNGKFNKDKIFVTLYNNFLYVMTTRQNPKINLLTHLSIESIFEDPREPYYYSSKGKELNYDVRAEEYPISKTMWDYMVNAIIQTKGNLFVNNQTLPTNELQGTIRS